jgi:hypothetical protein
MFRVKVRGRYCLALREGISENWIRCAYIHVVFVAMWYVCVNATFTEKRLPAPRPFLMLA